MFHDLLKLADFVRHKIQGVYIVGLIRPSNDECFAELQNTNELLKKGSETGKYIYCEVPTLFYFPENFMFNGQYLCPLMHYNLRYLLLEGILKKYSPNCLEGTTWNVAYAQTLFITIPIPIQLEFFIGMMWIFWTGKDVGISLLTRLISLFVIFVTILFDMLRANAPRGHWLDMCCSLSFSTS